ncbi:MAG TPA: hypothetical protein VGP89_09035 [Candidatus Angelobacter sp.]|jgi:hypothetical protein|nr:hypothetical protein [Candidatus Angelobacter sp.]
MLRTYPGFRTAGVMALEVNLPPMHYADSNQIAAFNERMLTKVRTLPGVTEAAVTTYL